MGKFREIIDKKIENEKTIEFTDLAPIDDIDNGDEYLKALHWALKNKKVKNVALAGPYGAGKSSIIETYLKKHKYIRRKSLRVSMATFIENKIDESGNSKKILLEQDEIELGILKQLFYKVNYKKIPQSRYRKLHKINWTRIWVNLIVIYCVFGGISFVFFPDTFQTMIEKIGAAGQQFGLKETVSSGIFIAFSLGILAIIAQIYRSVLFRFKVNEVKLPTETVVKNSEAASETVFNKNMDEIVYFFEETGYQVVFFEDLDRLDNPSIFIQLRELNTILNNYDVIKKRIIFVYAIRDDIFTDTDRTKFFDFIIPVIPIINSTNSGEIFLQRLQESKEIGINHEISQGFILDVAPYVEDMRILQNIYNEFIVYKKTIRTEQDLKLSDEMMMALVTFKNLYPRDFSDLQMERGIVKKALCDKQKYITDQSLRWQEEIAGLAKTLELYHKDSMIKIKELKISMLSALVNWEGSVRDIQINYYNTISVKSIISDSFDLSGLLKIKDCRINYYTWSGSNTSLSISDLQLIFKPYYERIQAFQIVQEKGLDELQCRIEILKNEIHNLSGWSIKKLIEKFGVQKVLSEQVRENKLLVFMLRRGYIDEKYANYINYFKGTSITKEDMNFILSVKNLEKLPYNYNLTKVAMVIQRLQIYEFMQKSIYNYILLEYLLTEDDDTEKLNIFIKQLADGSEESWNFINDFIDRTQCKEKFIKLLASVWNDMWNYIVQDVALTYERKIFYLSLLISEVNISRLSEMNGGHKINDFIVNNADILQQLSCVPNSKIISLIENIVIKFKNVLIENVSDEVLDYIFENQYYELNSIMIQRIVEFKNNTLTSGLNTYNYTTIIALGYEPLIEFVRENLKNYVETIVLAPNNINENVKQIMDLLERSIDEPEICLKIINHEEFCLHDITECCKNLNDERATKVKILWNELLLKGKVNLNWSNIEKYWTQYGLATELIQYIAVNVDELKRLDSTCMSEGFIKEFIKSPVDESVFEVLLPKLKLDNFDIPINEISRQRISVMIKQKYFAFDSNRYTEIKDVYPNLCSEFILHNQDKYMQIIESIPMDQSLLEKLLLSRELIRENIQILLKTFGESFMTSEIAKNLHILNVTIDKSLFNAAWTYLDEKGKRELMLRYLSILEASDFETCFSELSRWYLEFCDRTKRHCADLENTVENKKLAERLKEVSYITSYTVKERDFFDPITESQNKKSIISCWIKVVKS